jgi:hypothetical protein
MGENMATEQESYNNNYQELMLSLKAKSLAEQKAEEEDLLASLEARD